MPTASLYTLTADLLEAAEAFAACEDEAAEQAFLDTMESLGLEFQDKCDAYAKLMRGWGGDIDIIKAEEERLKRRRQMYEGAVDRLRARLLEAFSAVGETKVKTALFTFSVSRRDGAVEIADDAVIPKEFLIDQDPRLDKAALKKAIKDGRTFPGVHVGTTTSISIR